MRDRLAALLLLIVAVAPAPAADAPAFLYGGVQDNRYRSPSGEFTVTLPVQVELGGTVADTPEVVTFQDRFSIHASIACFMLDASQRREEETRGRRDYLAWFFSQHVQPQFRRRHAGASVESARFLPAVMQGALIVYNLLPGGSMLASAVALPAQGEAPVAKRGNLLFVHNRHLYVLSIELAEKVLDPAGFDWPVERQDDVLRQRLLELVGRMEFSVPPTG